VAAVRDGDVVLAAGWGVHDVAADLPATRDTSAGRVQGLSGVFRPVTTDA
jgi:CubicO group peptidase (beta-lactamase class C family)